MSTTDPRNHRGLTVLARDECLYLLGSAAVGRIGLTVGALPTILPVNFALLGEDVVIRTGWGAKLRAATDHQVVCFEVDGFDVSTRTGWSVLATGRAAVVDDPVRLARVRDLGLAPWARGARDHYVVLRTELLSGRRVGPVAATESLS